MTLPGTSDSVYVVMGTQGEYSDRHVWCAAAFRDEEEAKRFVEARQADIRLAVATHGEFSNALVRALDAIDPELVDWGDLLEVVYSLQEVPFR